MAAQRILRIPFSDDLESFVLVNAIRTGKTELNLKLVATEGEDPFVGSIRRSRLGELRAKNYQGSDKEWADILAHVFWLEHTPQVSQGNWASGLEVLATVKEVDDDRKQLTISLRKRIDGITQRLGAITLEQDDDQAIQLFEWNGIAVARANALETQISSLAVKYREAEETIAKLNNQLEDLVQTKNDHDDQLIAKFAQLLNEKKLKIRNQQRLLASATINTDKVAELDADSEAQIRLVGSSRRGKRKAEEREPSESEDSDGFERMSVERGKPEDDDEKEVGENDEAAQETDLDRQSTPEPLEDDSPTAGEDDDEDQELQSRLRRQKKEGEQASNHSDVSDHYDEEEPLSTRSRGSPASLTQKPARSKQTQPKKTDSPPPRRELPFNRRRTAAKGSGNESHISAPTAIDPPPKRKEAHSEPNETLEQQRDGEETGGETDDDEL